MNKKLLLIAMSAMIATSATSQETWTLDQCIRYALDNNVTVQKNRVQEQTGEEALAQAKASLWPSLNFSTSHGIIYRPLDDGSSIRVGESQVLNQSKKLSSNSSYSIGMNWTIWDGGVNYKQVEAQRLTNQQNRLTTQTSELSIQEQIAQLYIQILYTRESIKVSEELAATARQQYERGEEMQRQGQMSKADVVQLQAQWESAKYDIVNNQTTLSNYKRQLKNLLQLDLNTQFDIADTPLDDEAIMTPIPTASSVYAEALSTRPEIKNAQLDIESAELQYNIARRGYYPTIGISAVISDSHNTGSDNTIAQQLKGNLNMSASVNLSIPIWDARKTKTAKAKALLQKTNAELELQNQQNQLSSTIEQYWLNATNGQQKFLTAKAKATSQKTSYELVNEQFNNGLTNVVDVLQSRDLILTAEQDMLQSKYTTLYNIALLRFYQGKELQL